MTRVISGVALAAVALAAILFLPVIGLRVLALLVAVLAAHEYLHIVVADREGPRRNETVTSPSDTGTVRRGPLWSANGPVLLLVALVCWYVLLPTPQVLLGLILASLALLALQVLFGGAPIGAAGAALVAPWYVGLPLGMLVALQAINGPRATLLLLATVVLSDTAQFYTGRAFGRRPLAPTISPKKTIEGAVGGLIFGTAFMAIAGPLVFPGFAPVPMAVLGLTVVVLGICGDLFESRLKRDANLKDSSTLIPGHGGVLDRIDALLFAIPAYYLYLRP
jgi:phosphatidate cytidylyltransferase